MDVDSLLGVLVVVAAALLLSLTAACTAAGVLGARARTRYADGKPANRPEHLHQFTTDRERLLSELVMARIVWLVTGVAVLFSMVAQRTGIAVRPLVLTSILTIAVIAVLESIARAVVAHNPERWSPIVRPATESLRAIFLVPAYLVDLPARALLKIVALAPSTAPQNGEEELVRLVEMEESHGGIEDDERQMIRNVFELEDTTVREVMVPRIDMTAVSATATIQDVAALIAARGYSRIPLYQESLDNIVGVIYAKDVLAQLAGGAGDAGLTSIARPPHFVPETKRIDELLADLRARKVHIAIVVDEYGGTAGMVTFEDIVEEIVGEIEDEYDQSEPAIVRTAEGDAVVDARESVYVLKELFDVEVEPEDFDTVGGLIIHRLGRIPAANEAVDVDGLRLRVLSVAGRRIRKVRISRERAAPTVGANP
ncbi:MAG: hemolysin family protein [Dehalococcoidia bacterium]